jgi:hypothetical protein
LERKFNLSQLLKFFQLLLDHFHPIKLLSLNHLLQGVHHHILLHNLGYYSFNGLLIKLRNSLEDLDLMLRITIELVDLKIYSILHFGYFKTCFRIYLIFNNRFPSIHNFKCFYFFLPFHWSHFFQIDSSFQQNLFSFLRKYYYFLIKYFKE